MGKLLRFIGCYIEYKCILIDDPQQSEYGWTYKIKPEKKIYKVFGIKVYSTTKIDFS